MSSETAKTAIGSLSPAAERMRLVRQRRRQKLRCVRLWLHVTRIDELVRKGFLKREDRDNPEALEWAIDVVLDKVLDKTA
jgi:hypothetical protein